MTDAEWEQLMAEAVRLRVEINGKLDVMIGTVSGLKGNLGDIRAKLTAMKLTVVKMTAQLADTLGAVPVVAEAIMAISESGEAANLESIEVLRALGVDPLKAGIYMVTVQRISADPGEAQEAHSSRSMRAREP